MSYILLLLSFASMTASPLFSAEYQRRYEGNPEWEFEPRLAIVSKFIPKNPTVFEVGAFDGSDSATLSTYWPGGKVISFEANPTRFAEYKEKTKNLPNAFGYNLAVNLYNGFAKFHVCWGTEGKNPIFEGASSLLEPSESMKIHYMGPEITVPCVIFDDWCEKNNVNKIDFMWLDIEGFELQFLTSSPKILKTVRTIYTETNFYKFRKGTTLYPALRDFLESQGFTVVAHWYTENLQGDAIFVRKEYYNKND